ncbi:hypothetical protein VE03_06083 [Pseudogymnoascus sp. 23342-1-I1]|nr:hypothetical protein VE03_06083 [Pseudogymnoascus sp. 23342-1-I1]
MAFSKPSPLVLCPRGYVLYSKFILELAHFLTVPEFWSARIDSSFNVNTSTESCATHWAVSNVLGIVALGGQDAVSDIIIPELEFNWPQSLPRLKAEVELAVKNLG